MQAAIANERQVVPPVALSPSQQMQEHVWAAGPASVPVKKMPVQSPVSSAQQVSPQSMSVLPNEQKPLQTGQEAPMAAPEAGQTVAPGNMQSVNGMPAQTAEH